MPNTYISDFKRIVERQPDQIALIDGVHDIAWNWEELDYLIDRVGAWFSSKDLNRGDSIVTLLPNSVETLVIFFSCARYGIGMAPLSQSSKAKEVSSWIKMIDPAALMIASAAEDSEYSSIRTIKVDIDGEFKWVGESALSPQEDQPCGLLYIPTSGTTGHPKPLVHDVEILWESSKAFVDFHEYIRGRRFLNILPMSYIGGVLNLGLIPLSGGGSIVVVPEFSAGSFFGFWKDVKKYSIEVLWLVPSILRGLLKLARRTSSDVIREQSRSVRLSLLGTAPIDLKTKVEFERTFGFPLYENFGMSEVAFFVSEHQNNVAMRCEGSVGQVMPFAKIDLRPISDRSANIDMEVFDVYVRTPFVPKGYLQEDGKLVNPVEEDGFLRTGDIGRWDENRNLILSGRSRDIVKRGSMMVSLRELEIAALEFGEVEEAAAVPVPHEFYGESSVIFIRMKENRTAADIKPENIKKFLAQNLSHHKLPEDVRIVDEFPKTNSGKIRKDLLAESLTSIS